LVLEKMAYDRLFSCRECGGPVRPMPGHGRTFTHPRGVVREVPYDFLDPTCASCGELYYGPDTIDELLELFGLEIEA